MRKKIIAANWKMNKDYQEGLLLAKAIVDNIETLAVDTEVVLAPPFIHLDAINKLLDGRPSLKLAGQNCSEKSAGAYTGEISAQMLKSVGAEYVILGHSERRQYYGETDALILEKIQLALSNGLKVIYCCGESLPIREENHHEQYVGKQLDDSIMHLTAEELNHIIIAYEPIWAIGTGITAKPEQAQEMHWFIRWKLERKYGKTVSENISILYGGSVKADNATELFSQADIDGGLVGGASLVAHDFLQIVNS